MMGTRLRPWDTQPRHLAGRDPPRPPPAPREKPLSSLLSQLPKKGFSWSGGMCSAKRAKPASRRPFLWGLSAAELQKGNIDASSTPSIRAGPKNHHFLLACESLINSRQKGLIRKLFGKWEGRGRDRRSPRRLVALHGFAPRCHLPAPRDASLPRGPRVCSNHGPHPEPSPGALRVWLQPKSTIGGICLGSDENPCVRLSVYVFLGSPSMGCARAAALKEICPISWYPRLRALSAGSSAGASLGRLLPMPDPATGRSQPVTPGCSGQGAPGSKLI